ncbi:MAG: biosynthetic peptidoglycan transglycosylase, partial [Candidatus Levybacteria bacterium]|nr:biosynthetic peptidoglycan transglycosylase [Candidatus Levybacteria bacterium]
MEQLSSIAKGVIYELWANFKKPFIFFMAIFISFVILTPIFIYGYFAKDLVSKETIINNNNKGIALYDRNGQLFFNFYEAKEKEIVSLTGVPKHLQNAIISVEDKDFYDHPGFSFRAIVRAFYTNLINQDIKYGASTITQQLVKNSLLNPEKTFFRKYQEIVLAFEIERLYSKKEILEMYLNTVYLGENATGVGSAAKAYFSKNVKDVNLAESALLAAILPAPSRYSPISGDRKEALRLQKRVLKKMEEQNYISADEKYAGEKQNISLSPASKTINTKAIHFALMVRDKFLEEYPEQELASSGFK